MVFCAYRTIVTFAKKLFGLNVVIRLGIVFSLLNVSFADEQVAIIATNELSKVPIPESIELWLPGLRGRILSSDGMIFAETVDSSSLGLRWHLFDQDESVLNWVHDQIGIIQNVLNRNISISDKDILQAYKLRPFQPFLIADLSKEESDRVIQEKLEGKDFVLMHSPRRVYLQGTSFCHGVGYVKRSQVRNSGALKNGEVYYDKYTGGFGLEKVLDKELSGKDGQIVFSTDKDGFFRDWRILQDPGLGLNVRTTIDSKIQRVVEESMAMVKTGAAVFLRPENGEVVAMVSKPSFDPNSFFPSISPEFWKEINADPKIPLLDRSYLALHPPGSIFKVITSIAAMRANVFDPDEVIDCKGILQVGDMQYKFPSETNSVNYHDALVVSCNTYFMNLGIKTGRDVLISVAKDLGVGQKTGIELSSEPTGRMPDPDFVKKQHHRIMGSGDVANTSIGQGDVVVTPLQAANWMAAIANGGTLYKPHLVLHLEDQTGTVVKTIPSEVIRHISIPQDGLKLLKECLQDVVFDGTGQPSQVPGLDFAAKTGTAQVGTKDKPRQVVWMNGFVPSDKPQYAFAVMIEGSWEEDLHGGDHVGPIVGNILSRIFALPAKAEAVPLDKKSED
jgi:penicillin-binding protein 2